ncbi:methylosome protein WDR77 isoform X2 [Macrobrachium rosenbergii]|uniref:methylosome protein WDR77 isoform X2 n=1 Tax=Macrobrachium rosenbergii TaxID=79674 RepID=UPI0034D624E6
MEKMANTSQREENDLEMNSPEEQAEMDITSPQEMEHVDHIPCQVEKHLDFITFNKHGHLLMGSSSLTGRYWGGSLWYYETASLAPDVEKCTSGHEITSGLADGVYLDDETSIMIGQDTGTVEFLTIAKTETGTHLRSVCQLDEHLDVVHCVKVTCNRKNALTASADMSIRLWDSEGYRVVRLFSVAHSQPVTSVAPHPSNDQIFLSTGMDGNVLLWDLRCLRPASCVYRDWDSKPESVVWTPGPGMDNYVVGTQNGALLLRSTGNLNESLFSLNGFERPIFRMCENPFRPNLIAVCADDSKVLVVDVQDTLKTKYEDDRHSDFVRGMAWKDTDTLVTCGWDKKVYFHFLSL